MVESGSPGASPQHPHQIFFEHSVQVSSKQSSGEGDIQASPLLVSQRASMKECMYGSIGGSSQKSDMIVSTLIERPSSRIGSPDSRPFSEWHSGKNRESKSQLRTARR